MVGIITIFMIGIPLYVKKRVIPYFKEFTKNEKIKLLLEFLYPVSIVVSFVILGRGFFVSIFVLVRTMGISPFVIFAEPVRIAFLITLFPLILFSLYKCYKILEKIKALQD